MRFNEGLWQTHRFGVGKRLIDVRERVGSRPDCAPRDGIVVAVEQPQRTHEVADFTPPAAADLEMLAVDLLMDVDRAGAGVGVMARDDVGAAVAYQIERFFDRT